MIKFAFKVLVWLAIGFAVTLGAVRFDIDAASPWQYQVTTSPAGVSVGELDVTTGEPFIQSTLHLGRQSAQKTFDLGVLAFLVALYGAGTVMGLLLKGKKIRTDRK